MGTIHRRNRWAAVIVSAAVTVFCMSALPQLLLDNSNEGFLYADDPASIQHRAFRDELDGERAPTRHR